MESLESPGEPSLASWLRTGEVSGSGAEAEAHEDFGFCQAHGQLEGPASGATFVGMSRAASQEAEDLWWGQQVAEVYTALVRGLLPLHDVVCCRRRLCRPTEGSVAWRLAGSRSEGREACTLLRGLHSGRFNGEPCTLVELRPVTGCPQQLLLHCVAVGHPIVGDETHDADRRLDWRFDQPLSVPRLMLHCWHLRVPLARGVVEATAPDPLGELLECDEEDQLNPRPTFGASSLLDAPVTGLTTQTSAPDAWSSFAGGLSSGIRDDTHWDVPQEHVRRVWSRPYGPPEWDDRAGPQQ